MPSPSSIRSLPKEILAAVNRLLVDDGWTLDQITTHLRDAGHPRSRSALGRYKTSLSQVADQMNRSQEMAEALCREVGPGATEGKTGRMLFQILQSLVFDHLTEKAGDENNDSSPVELMRLAKTLKDMAGAQKIDTDRELKIRADERHKVVTDTAETGARVLSEAGVQKETIEAFRKGVLGISE